jgi:hypothetical protein
VTDPAERFVAFLGATAIVAILDFAVSRRGSWGQRGRKGLAVARGFWLGCLATLAIQALVASQAWWWFRQAFGEVAFLFGGGVRAFVAGKYSEHQRAAEPRRAVEPAGAVEVTVARGRNGGG